MSDEREASGPASEGGPKIRVSDRRHWAREPAHTEAQPEAAQKPFAGEYPTFVEQLRSQLKAKDEKLKEFMARVEEENEAFRLRTQKEVDRRTALAMRSLVQECLSVLDDLERAISSGKQCGDSVGVLEGVRIVHRQLLDLLQRHGLSLVETGATFDPRVHEAVEGVLVSDESDHHRILEVIQPGYRFREILLRPARVRVAVARQAELTQGE